MPRHTGKEDGTGSVFRAILRGIVAPIAIALAIPAGYVFFADQVPFSVYKMGVVLLVAIPAIAVVFWQDIKTFFPDREDCD